jgi:hypothetical protein
MAKRFPECLVSALAPGIPFVRMHAKMQICGMYDLHGIPRKVECTDKGRREKLSLSL